jgi:hypothetical protein
MPFKEISAFNKSKSYNLKYNSKNKNLSSNSLEIVFSFLDIYYNTLNKDVYIILFKYL